MNVFMVFSVLMLIIGIVFFVIPAMVVPTFDDIEHQNDSIVYVGEGETCQTYNTRFKCKAGLECKTIDYEHYRTGICLVPETTIEEYEVGKVVGPSPGDDFIPRNPANDREDSKIVNLNSTGLEIDY